MLRFRRLWMDEAIRVAQLLSPLLMVGVAIVGLRAWYWQLIAKRRFEVAEQAMTVFERANDALSIIRTQVLFGGDRERVEIPEGLDAAERAAHRNYGTYFVRLSDHAEAFETIRLSQVLCAPKYGSEFARTLPTSSRTAPPATSQCLQIEVHWSWIRRGKRSARNASHCFVNKHSEISC